MTYVGFAGDAVLRRDLAVLPSDLEQILDYCDVYLLGVPPEKLPGGLPRMKADFFLRDNRGVLDPLFL